ncbi:hypothetical protein [uncultured Desulfovibrio sp.]|uniref:hypothetical protein n=1 Tax=uncultured Desulfovibrio sp. TaxID=167968 RepID=UPI0026DABA51|nr:hypothetical protein [uncultured Desulfovibrio sp.]
MNILLRLTSRPTYSRVEYSTPDEAVLRCLAGLLFPDVSMAALKPGVHTPPSSDEEKSGDDKHHDANKTQGAITHEHPRSDFKKLIHKLLLPPEAACSFDDAAAESQSKFSRSEGQVHDSALHYDPSNRYHRSHCGYPDNDSFHDLLLSGGIQRHTDQRPKECRHGHGEPQHRFPAVEGDETTQHGLPPSQPNLNCAAYHTDDKANDKAQDKLKHFPHPLPARLRAAWWGWL